MHGRPHLATLLTMPTGVVNVAPRVKSPGTALGRDDQCGTLIVKLDN